MFIFKAYVVVLRAMHKYGAQIESRARLSPQKI